MAIYCKKDCVPSYTIRWLHWNLLFHWDLAVFVCVKRNADVSAIEHKGLVVQ